MAWGRTARDPDRPLLWMHAPSVGEGLQARPVLDILRARHAGWQFAYTFFSPSAERFARSLDADFADYLPFDTTGDMRIALDALRPRAIVFSKLDVWPTLVREADERGVSLALISATLAPGSSRRGRIATALLREAYSRLDAVGAIDADDAARLAGLGARRAVITVSGDTRYDQVWARAQTVRPDNPQLAPLRTARLTLVAGSTWPADEAVLLPAWEQVHRSFPGARVIVAPHEPHAARLSAIESWAARAGLSCARLGAATAGTSDVVLVDRVGVLGELYALADAAYVGGGFHAAGLHSVLEPAAFGAPVLVGPRHADSRDAVLLLRSGGARSVSDTTEAVTALGDWFARAGARHDAGEQARRLVHDGLGAAQRSAALVEALFDA
ncbi:MAG TPA: glycosyltransferase N-terminal domain-containing protein [Gemmatimonadaceae bacterium]